MKGALRKIMTVKAIAKGLDSLSRLTRMHFALYDDKQQLLASSSTDDKLVSILKAKRILQAAYNTFLDRQLKLSLVRQDPFIIQGFTGQYHAFIPLHYEGTAMTAVAEAFYTSEADFKRFYFSNHGRALDVIARTEEDWLKDIRIYSPEEITSVLGHARSILQAMITSEFDNGRLNKSSQQSRTIISIMSDINYDYSVRNIYQIVIDAVIFLFEIDTAAFFVKKDGQYRPEVSEGVNKELIKDLSISVDNRLVTTATSDATSVSTMSSHELLHAGFPEEISLVTLFPFPTEAGLLGILAILTPISTRRHVNP